MSYYDHATMMAHKLGPWADDRGCESSDFERQRRKTMKPALRRIAARMLAMIGIGIRIAAVTGGDEAGKT